MYHRGRDRGWHQGHQRDVFPPRNHQSSQYRGGYQDHRDHNDYGQYDHNACHDRNYNENEYMEYEEPAYHDYHEEDRPYHDHRNIRDQAYHVRGRHDSGYQNDFRGGYQQSHGESGRYHNVPNSQRKKYNYRGFKPQMQESDVRMKTTTAKPVQSVVHNPVHSVVPSVSGNSMNPSETKIVPSQDKNLAQETAIPVHKDAEAVQEGTKPEDNHKKPTKDETQPVQNGTNATNDGAKPAQVSAEPSKEDTKLLRENKKPSEENIKPLDKGANPAKERVKVEHVDTNTEINKHIGAPVGDTKPSTTEMTAQLSCKIESMEETKEDIQILPVLKEEKQDFSITGDEAQEETFLGKRMCSQDEHQFFMNKTVEIPLLDGWADMPSESIEAATTSTKRHSETVVDYGLSHTARELRKAFILAKKEEIELAFSQDCRTFAFVASTLLKKDPSLETALSNALRSTLQDIAGRCVQELSKFIDHYDNIL